MLHLLRKLLPRPLLAAYHFLLAYAAAFAYGFPSRHLTVIGVTGTYGKSSVVMLLGRVLCDADIRAGWFSTATIHDGQSERLNALKMTMPGRFALQRFLRDCLRNGCTHAIIETSSQGIVQHRHRGIAYDIALLTNLSPEHLEAHGGFDAYRAAKVQLFASVARSRRTLRIAIVPEDLELPEEFTSHPFARKIAFGGETDRDASTASASSQRQISRARAHEICHLLPHELRMLAATIRAFPGNVAAVLAVAGALGVDRTTVLQSLQHIPFLPGRLEAIDEGQSFEVVVDYAFTPQALEVVYRALGSAAGRTIHVLGGAGGGRDRWKYPVTGRIAAQHADVVIVTNEDPYDDDPAAIIRAVADGARKWIAEQGSATIVEEILDRRVALARALALAQPGDRILVTGKGCEQAIVGPRGTKVPWDDRVVLRELLRTRSDRMLAPLPSDR